MATPSAQLDRSATRERVLDVLRSLLSELGSEGALPMLGSASRLDRDLGLGSLERVELLARLETEFGVRLPDRVAAEVNTPDELAGAILAAPGTEPALDETSSTLRASVTTQKLRRAAGDQGVFAAQTLLDVLRYRAVHDARRIHLHISEDSVSGEKTLTLTFAELYEAAQRCAAELAAARRSTRRPRVVDAAYFSERFSFRMEFSLPERFRSDLSAFSCRPHRRIRGAPGGNTQQRGSLFVIDVPARRSRRQVAEARVRSSNL